MSTITVHRTAPDSTFSPDIEVTLHHLPQTWSWSNIKGMLSTSLSGEKGDYSWNFDTPTATLSLSSKLSYRDRFHTKQVDCNDLRAEMTRLTRRMTALENKLTQRIITLEDKLDNGTQQIITLEDKLDKRTQADEYHLGIIMKVQIYTSLGQCASQSKYANIYYMFTTTGSAP